MAIRPIIGRSSTTFWSICVEASGLPSAAELLARTEGRNHPDAVQRLPYYEQIIHDYPDSPYLAFALREKAHALDDAQRTDEAARIYAELIKRRPLSPYRSEALRYLANADRTHGNIASALNWARQWTDAAPIQERFLAHMLVAELLRDSGDAAGAKQAAGRAGAAARAYMTAANSQTRYLARADSS